MRIYYTVKLRNTGNFTYLTVVIGLWCLPEVLMGFVAACVPVLPRFFQETRLAQRLRKWFCFGTRSEIAQDQSQLLRRWPGSVSTDLDGLKTTRVGHSNRLVPPHMSDQHGSTDLRSSRSSIVEDTDYVPPLLHAYGITKTVEISTEINEQPGDTSGGYDPREHWSFGESRGN
jgi:hypothetical protein